MISSEEPNVFQVVFKSWEVAQIYWQPSGTSTHELPRNVAAASPEPGNPEAGRAKGSVYTYNPHQMSLEEQDRRSFGLSESVVVGGSFPSFHTAWSID